MMTVNGAVLDSDAQPARFAFEPSENAMPDAERGLALADPGFGKVFTDHMFVMRYLPEQGWHAGVIRARAPIALDPACAVLHYAQEIFEGMKAYRTGNGDTVLFRPEENAARFRRSAVRMAMPPIPDAVFVAAVEAYVAAERSWVPAIDGGSLYLRPFMFASEAFLGVRPATEYLFVIIASLAGQYFRRGAGAITVWASEDYVRASPGGTGAAKCGGNYAASLLAQGEAVREQCDQVLFLDAVEHRWVEELGGMNLFFVFDDGSILTPPLEGTILPGITRDSLITIARDLDLSVREERYSLEQWVDDAASGKLVEAFACGTAATVAGIGSVRGRGFDAVVGDGRPGAVTLMLRSALIAIQTGRQPDSRNWVRLIKGEALPI